MLNWPLARSFPARGWPTHGQEGGHGLLLVAGNWTPVQAIAHVCWAKSGPAEEEPMALRTISLPRVAAVGAYSRHRNSRWPHLTMNWHPKSMRQ